MVQCGKNICSASHLNENSCNFIEYEFGHTWAQSKQLIKRSQSQRTHRKPNNSMIIFSQILQCCNAVTLHWLVSSCVFIYFELETQPEWQNKYFDQSPCDFKSSDQLLRLNQDVWHHDILVDCSAIIAQEGCVTSCQALSAIS